MMNQLISIELNGFGLKDQANFLSQRICVLLLALFCTICSHAQVLKIQVSDKTYGIDEGNNFIVSHIDEIENYASTSQYDEIILCLNQRNLKFIEIPSSINFTTAYLVRDEVSSQEYSLYFTLLPIIQIGSDLEIVDEPKVMANFIYADQEEIIESNIGIEIRGGFSQSYPKKTYDLEFWNDEFGDETKDVNFGDLRSDDDWILDALYNEPLRLRSYVANKLWLEMHSLYYIEEEPDAYAGANVLYAEMFVNGSYQGLYNISEPIDRKQLKLKSYDEGIRGELYKGITWGASTFGALPNYDNENREWSGYEYKYPKEGDGTDWENLYQFTNFVMNSSEEDFTRDIWSKFDFTNYSDYFLFLNLIRATDNTGKNIYLAKYDIGEPYFYVPWDLDGCFGTSWDGTNENITNDILSNGFFNRVTDSRALNSKIDIAKKWFDYRENLFSFDYLENIFTTHFEIFQTNKVYEREALVYPNYSFDEQELSYLLSWLEDRIAYLDEYFGDIISSTEEHGSKPLINIYPNPADEKVFISPPDDLNGQTVKIFNSLGVLIEETFIEGNSLSLYNLNKGIYFVELNAGIFKLIKN